MRATQRILRDGRGGGGGHGEQRQPRAGVPPEPVGTPPPHGAQIQIIRCPSDYGLKKRAPQTKDL